VFIPDHVLLQLTQSLTLEVYIQIHAIPPANHDFTEIVFRGDDRGALDPYSLALIPDGRLVFHVADTFNNIADVVSPFPLPLDQPLHVAGTLDDATGAQKLFINGQEVASQVTNIRPFAMLDPLRNPGVGIGSLQSTLLPQFFDGILDEVRISNVALTPSEFLPPPLVGGVINDFVSFEPIPSTFTFTPDPTGCPEGFVGTFGFEAQLTNISTSVLSDLVVTVTTLTNGNLLLNADGGLGGGGALLTIPHKDQYGDGTLQETEFVDVPFTICLHALTPFHFFVDVLGKSRQQPQPRRTMRIQALIDGRSQLLLRGNTAQWHHFDFAAPGRHDFQNVPTVINGVVWLPVWPDQPDAENRDCDCVSDVFLGVEPPLPPTAAPVQLRTIRSRFDTQIVQQPTAANDFTLIIEFNDNPPGGDDFYIAEIDVAM
jgi:hypothetical protein